MQWGEEVREGKHVRWFLGVPVDSPKLSVHLFFSLLFNFLPYLYGS